MRLNPQQIDVIKDAVRKHFSPEARVWLFGSRVDDAKRGGDIDLLVESAITGGALQEARIRTMGAIQLALGEQKIDIVTLETGKKPEILIQIEALRTGILL